jgi:arylsulfatase A-like enzyme
MAESCSNIKDRSWQLSTVYLLFTPLAGLVCYKFLIYLTQPSPLMFVGRLDSFSAFFTMLFVAFVVAVAATALASIGLLTGKKAAEDAAREMSLALFAALTTLLALVAIENFTYTMFRVGIKNTDGIAAKLLYLALAAGLFWLFRRIGKGYHHTLRENSPVIMGLVVALSGVVALFNTSISGPAWASLEQPLSKRYNILVLSSDGIDASRVSAYGYERKTTPFIDSIADEFLIARNAYPNNGHTTGAITSLLTGMLPTRSKVVFPPDSLSGDLAHQSLPRLLRNQGYFANNIAVPHYADASEQNILEAFDVNNNRDMLSSSLPVTFKYKATNWFFDRLISETNGLIQDVLWLREMPNPYSQVDGHTRGTKYGFNDALRLKGIIETIETSDQAFFINSHFLGTHGPYFDPEMIKFSEGDKDKEKPWSRDRYDDAILTFDDYVRRVFAVLEERDLVDKTIVIVMSDHGISHDPRKKIPLMIRFPGKAHAGTVIEQNVQVIDIAPTLLDFLGAEIPGWMEGDSLIAGGIAPHRNIFSASVDEVQFMPGVGVVKILDRRFGPMDQFYLMRCGSQYKLNVHSGSMVRTDDADNGTCQPDQVLSEEAARDVMMTHLESRYPPAN